MGITTSQKMGVAALIMAGSVLLSRFMGLIRDKVVSWQFGAGAESDVYFSAFVVPEFLNHLLAGGYISITLIPLLAAAFKENEDDGWRFFGTVLCWATAGIILLTAVAWIAAPNLAPLVAPGFTEAKLARLASFLRIILPAQIFFLAGSCLTAILYIRKQFFVPALTPLVYNACIIAGGLLLPGHGMEGFCWGVLAGAALGAFVLPLWAVRRGAFRFIPGWWHKKLFKMAMLALPLMLGLSVTVMDEQFIRVFGTMAGDGAVSLLNYARRIMMVPVGVVAQAAGVASFPFLAALVVKGDEKTFDDTLRRVLRASIYVVVPLCLLMIILSAPGLGVFFEGGRFSAGDTAQAAPLLQVMLLAVPFWTVQQVMGRAFYARQDTLTPAVVGTIVTGIVVCVYPFAVRSWGAPGVAGVSSGGMVLYTLALCAVWIRKRGRGVFSGLARPLFSSLSIGCPAALAGSFVSCKLKPLSCLLADKAGEIFPVSAQVARHMIDIGVGGSIFAGCYIALAYLFAREALELGRKKF